MFFPAAQFSPRRNRARRNHRRAMRRCGERVGICGRSGSGKSSLALALVRVVECFRGSILVDGQDIREFPLALLRSGVTVISQDAHLFSGNVREAIDPLGQVSEGGRA